MTIWKPDLDDIPGPRYLAIAEALGRDIEKGRLAPGARLPTHRELARRLGMTVGTVTRAFAEAESRGLVRGEVGRGTFVRQLPQEPVGWEPERDGGLLDLSVSVPSVPQSGEERQVLEEAFAQLARKQDLPRFLAAQPHAGMPEHRRAGARWLARRGLEVGGERVLVTCGAQHSMAAALATLAHPGDTVLTEGVTFPGIKGLAHLLHLRLEGLAMDGEGLLPEALEEACLRREARLLYLIPTLQNPTSALMTPKRREAIAEVAQRHDLQVVEDDVYGFLPEDGPAPIASLLPRRTFFVASTSKLVAPGLRVGFLAAPEKDVDRLAAAIWTTTWMAAPPLVEIVARWIDEGTLERFARWRREEATARMRLAREILGPVRASGHPQGFNLWLPLPEPWRSADLTREARRRGVAVSPAEIFAPGRCQAPHAVRLSLVATPDRSSLAQGLRTLREILEQPPDPCVSVA